MRKTLILLGCMFLGACAGKSEPVAQNDPPKPLLQGKASFYGHESGHRTASGKIFRPKLLTAASRTLPFGTKVRVTNLMNAKAVIVEINDRGPARWTGREIDLSEGAAKRIQMVQTGVVPVTMEVVP